MASAILQVSVCNNAFVFQEGELSESLSDRRFYRRL